MEPWNSGFSLGFGSSGFEVSGRRLLYWPPRFDHPALAMQD